METKLTSATKQVIISPERPTVLIGERINPTGKKKLTEALQNGDLDLVRKEALAQVQAGADVLDINVGAIGVDEAVLLPRAVQAVMDTVDVPLCLDSANPAALEEALRIYRGKALVNSVTGQEHSLSKTLPSVKRYGAAVIGLTMDENGIPDDAGQRLTIARRIVEYAEAMNIAREDIIIDCLALAVGADTEAALAAIENIRTIRAQLGVNLTLGVSNVSFGLPDRNLINSAFVTIAIAMGVNCPIVDVAEMRPAILAADLILGRDKYAMRYIKAYQQRKKH